MNEVIKVDIWSDIICPFCYIGKKRLMWAASAENVQLDVTWRSFELDANSPLQSKESLVELVSRKYRVSAEQSAQSQRSIAATAAEEGIDFQWERARPGNTFNAHRVIHYAASVGLGDKAQERFMQAYMAQGEDVGDTAVVARLAESIGLDAEKVRSVLASDQYAADVRNDERIAQTQLQVSGVPFFLFEGRLTVSGAQSREVFRQALRQIATTKQAAAVAQDTKTPPNSNGGICDDGICSMP